MAPQTPTSSSERPAGKTLRVLSKPAATLLLFLLLVADLSYITRYEGREHSVVGSALKLSESHITYSSPYHYQTYIDAGGVAHVQPQHTDPVQQAQAIGLIHFNPVRWESGWYELTQRRLNITMHSTCFPVGNSYSAQEIASFNDLMQRAALAEFAASYGLTDKAHQALLTTGAWSDTDLLWWGYLHNAIAGGTSILFMISLGMVINRAIVQPARHERRRQRGRCVACNYPLAGIKTKTCPECGHTKTHSML